MTPPYMRILLYEAAPDLERAPILHKVATALSRLCHEVVVAVEERSYLFETEGGRPLAIDCRRTIRAYLNPRAGHYRVVVCDPCASARLSGEDSADLAVKLRCVREGFLDKVEAAFSAEALVVWNGGGLSQRDVIRWARRPSRSKSLFFLELGWFPQAGHIYVDPQGVNAAAAISRYRCAPLDTIGRDRLERWRQNYLGESVVAPPGASDGRVQTILVPLQVDSDTNIQMYSPFSSMDELIGFLEGWVPSGLFRVVLRPHPRAGYTYPLTTTRDDFTVERRVPLERLFEQADIVIGVNSTVLLEAGLRRLPVIRFGHGIVDAVGPPVKPDADFCSALGGARDEARASRWESLLYHLVFEKQIELDSTTDLADKLADCFGRGLHYRQSLPKLPFQLEWGRASAVFLRGRYRAVMLLRRLTQRLRCVGRGRQ